MKTLKVDPLVRAMKKTYHATEVFKLEQQLKKRSFWQRRETIARNKLAQIEAEIFEDAKQRAGELDSWRNRLEVLP